MPDCLWIIVAAIWHAAFGIIYDVKWVVEVVDFIISGVLSS